MRSWVFVRSPHKLLAVLWALALLTAACSGRAAPERADPRRSPVAGGETDGNR